jgi:hypothetical protein
LRRLAPTGGYPSYACAWLFRYAVELDEDVAALAVVENWLRSYPADEVALQSRANLEFKLGAYQRAAATNQELLAQKPGDADLLNQRAVAEFFARDERRALASLLEALSHKPDHPHAIENLGALDDYLRRERLKADYLLEKMRLCRALILVRRGEHAKAVEAAGAEVTEKQPGGDTLAALACVYALASAAAASDRALSADERSNTAELYACLAVAALQKAREAGYFKERVRAELLLDEEPDLGGLRQRADFGALRRDLARANGG